MRLDYKITFSEECKCTTSEECRESRGEHYCTIGHCNRIYFIEMKEMLNKSFFSFFTTFHNFKRMI